MSTSMKKAKAHKPGGKAEPAKAESNATLKAVVATGKPRAGDKVAPSVSKSREVPPLKVAATSTAKKTSPAAKKPVKAPSSKLNLVTPMSATEVAVHASPKVVAPQPVQNKVCIFQIYYRPEQRQHLDPAFEPYNNEGDNSPLLEFNVFRKLANSELAKGADLWGALSWKFAEKTGLNGGELRDFIAANPGFDVYYCNPYPELEALYHNLWLQGETSHPNFLILCHEFFEAAGLPLDAMTTLQPSTAFAASNYFIATPTFWRGYLDFISRAIERADKRMSSTAKAMIYSSAADQKSMHAAASYLPFIVERLFSVYLTRSGGSFKATKIPLKAKDGKLNVHQQLLRQMKDTAVSSRSLWLASCWVNYRNLYLMQFHGRDWCQRYLKPITPTSLQFEGGASAGDAARVK